MAAYKQIQGSCVSLTKHVTILKLKKINLIRDGIPIESESKTKRLLFLLLRFVLRCSTLALTTIAMLGFWFICVHVGIMCSYKQSYKAYQFSWFLILACSVTMNMSLNIRNGLRIHRCCMIVRYLLGRMHSLIINI